MFQFRLLFIFLLAVGIPNFQFGSLLIILKLGTIHTEVKDMKNMDTKEIQIIPLKYDFMFKRVFSLNLELLKEFLICVLDLEVDAKDANIILENVELTKSVKREYQKTVDILVRLNNPIIPSDISIDVEVNSSRYEDIKYRNVLYLQKIMTSYIESSSNLKDMTKYSFYQLNLNVHKFKDNTGEKSFI